MSLEAQRRVAACAHGIRAIALAAIVAAILQCCSTPEAQGQMTQQRVYGAASATTTTAILPAYNKDSSTEALSELPGAPFADRLGGGLLAGDGQAKFLFVQNPMSDSISTPQWTSTLTITAQSGALPAETLQLALPVN